MKLKIVTYQRIVEQTSTDTNSMLVSFGEFIHLIIFSTKILFPLTIVEHLNPIYRSPIMCKACSPSDSILDMMAGFDVKMTQISQQLCLTGGSPFYNWFNSFYQIKSWYICVYVMQVYMYSWETLECDYCAALFLYSVFILEKYQNLFS